MKVRFEMTAARDGVRWIIDVKSSHGEPFTFYVEAVDETDALDVAEKMFREHLEAWQPLPKVTEAHP